MREMELEKRNSQFQPFSLLVSLCILREIKKRTAEPYSRNYLQFTRHFQLDFNMYSLSLKTMSSLTEDFSIFNAFINFLITVLYVFCQAQIKHVDKLMLTHQHVLNVGTVCSKCFNLFTVVLFLLCGPAFIIPPLKQHRIFIVLNSISTM